MDDPYHWQMKQLDVVVSPSAFLWDPYLTLTNIHHHTKFEPPKSNGSRDINFYLVIFDPMNYFLVTDRRTDGQTDGWTDGRRRIRTHRAWAQVGSKIKQTSECLCYIHFDLFHGSSNLTTWIQNTENNFRQHDTTENIMSFSLFHNNIQLLAVIYVSFSRNR